MTLKHFKYLQEKGMSDCAMLEIVKCQVIPKLNISFDEFVFRHGINSIYLDELWRCSVWEVYLNILMREYKIPVNVLEDLIKNAICTQKEENRQELERIMKKYNEIINSKAWLD